MEEEEVEKSEDKKSFFLSRGMCLLLLLFVIYNRGREYIRYQGFNSLLSQHSIIILSCIIVLDKHRLIL